MRGDESHTCANCKKEIGLDLSLIHAQEMSLGLSFVFTLGVYRVHLTLWKSKREASDLNPGQKIIILCFLIIVISFMLLPFNSSV